VCSGFGLKTCILVRACSGRQKPITDPG